MTLGVMRADRVFGILRENNPELTGEKRRTIMKPPQVRGSCPTVGRACDITQLSACDLDYGVH